MNKSQLRKLAVRRAQGGLNEEEYLRRRHELIDQIVSGEQAIEREIPPPRPQPAAADPSAPDGNAIVAGASPARAIPLHYYFAAGASICVLILIWALWPAADKPETTPVAPPPPVQKISEARVLVESFLALRDYSEEAVGKFERNWDKLSDEDRQQARNALWFKSLSRNIRDEVKTQRALAQLAASADSSARIERLYRLAQTLEIGQQLPARGQRDAPPAAEPAAPAPVAVTEAAPDQPSPQQATASNPADAPTPQAEAAITAPTGADGDTATAREWLAAQPDAYFSLQIFAVNKLARVEQLMARHPDHAFQILATDGASPRFRVYLGSYPDKDQAARAFQGLAQDVQQAAGKALVKSFAEIRAQLAGAAAGQAVSTVAAPPPQPQYTLQLFASGNRDNASALSHKFSALGLELHDLRSGPSPYRVIYGRFASQELARQARAALPADLLGRVGTPLIKSLAELGIEN